MATVSFAENILPLFTTTDIQHMSGLGVPLNDYSYMSVPANAQTVYNQLASKQMPPAADGGPWSDANIALFQSWMQGGYQP
jgi:hypothetical protein